MPPIRTHLWKCAGISRQQRQWSCCHNIRITRQISIIGLSRCDADWGFVIIKIIDSDDYIRSSHDNKCCVYVCFNHTNITIGKEIFIDWNSLTHIKLKSIFFDNWAGYHNSYCTLQNVKLSHLTLFEEHPLNILTHLTTFVSFKVLGVAQNVFSKVFVEDNFRSWLQTHKIYNSVGRIFRLK